MRLLVAGLAAILAGTPVAVAATSALARPLAKEPVPTVCDDGKITKKIAGAKWKMRGCNDGHSLILVFKENDPVKMAIIGFNYGDTGYEVATYGKVDQPEVRAAAEWARTLTVPEIEVLYAETQTRKKR